MEQALERWFQRLSTDLTHTFSDWPVHQAGVAFFFHNESPTVPVTVSFQSSQDGAIWTVQLFSTPTLSGQIQVVVGPRCKAVCLLATQTKYLRVSMNQQVPEGLFFHMVQWMPRTPQLEDQEYS